MEIGTLIPELRDRLYDSFLGPAYEHISTIDLGPHDEEKSINGMDTRWRNPELRRKVREVFEKLGTYEVTNEREYVRTNLPISIPKHGSNHIRSLEQILEDLGDLTCGRPITHVCVFRGSYRHSGETTFAIVAMDNENDISCIEVSPLYR